MESWYQFSLSWAHILNNNNKTNTKMHNISIVNIRTHRLCNQIKLAYFLVLFPAWEPYIIHFLVHYYQFSIAFALIAVARSTQFTNNTDRWTYGFVFVMLIFFCFANVECCSVNIISLVMLTHTEKLLSYFIWKYPSNTIKWWISTC